MEAANICIEIGKSVKLTNTMIEAKNQKWPTSINFEALPKRIMQLKEKLMSFFSDPKSLDLVPSWAALVVALREKRMTFEKFNDLGEKDRLKIVPEAYNAG